MRPLERRLRNMQNGLSKNEEANRFILFYLLLPPVDCCNEKTLNRQLADHWPGMRHAGPMSVIALANGQIIRLCTKNEAWNPVNCTVGASIRRRSEDSQTHTEWGGRAAAVLWGIRLNNRRRNWLLIWNSRWRCDRVTWLDCITEKKVDNFRTIRAWDDRTGSPTAKESVLIVQTVMGMPAATATNKY